eukprot:scaffold27028_cov68-Phaeocystis_antarctica.AAC.1
MVENWECERHAAAAISSERVGRSLGIHSRPMRGHLVSIGLLVALRHTARESNAGRGGRRHLTPSAAPAVVSGGE